MSRRINEDLKKLVNYFQTYNLKHLEDNAEYKSHIKPMHKRIYGYLIFVEEIQQLCDEECPLDKTSMSYLIESLSDIIQAVSCWANGLYKPGKMLLRSSIELYTKAVVGIVDKNVFTKKSLYEVFDMAESSSYFNNLISKNHYQTLRSIYSLLCKTTHAGTKDELIGIKCIGNLPKYLQEESESFYKVFLKILDVMLSNLLINNYKIVYNIHPVNRRDFFEIIPREEKRKIHKYMTS